MRSAGPFPGRTKLGVTGPPADLESYVQECGRAGRNCQPANALLFWKKADFKSQHTACKDMKDYCTNTVMCRRATCMLMAYFDSTFDHIIECSCCDICALNCECTSCNCKSFLFKIHLYSHITIDNNKVLTG